MIDDKKLIKDDSWRLFRNVQKLIVHTTKHNRRKPQRFDLLKFVVRLPTDIHGFSVMVKSTRNWREQDQASWLLEEYDKIDKYE